MTEQTFNPSRDYEFLQHSMEAVRHEMARILIGQDEFTGLLLAGLLSNGHMLLEGVPGVAKTLSAKLLAQLVDARFSRMQFTPDMMPSDVIGTTVFDPARVSFTFRPGPVFSQIVLIDEINRAPAKTQAALFEVMEERQVTIDGHTHPMQDPFIVLATQNPIEQEGTYRLPEAQLDRFLFKILVGYPALEAETDMLRRHQQQPLASMLHEIKPLLQTEALRTFRLWVQAVTVEEKLLAFITKLVRDTRSHPALFLGASPRATLALLDTSKSWAAMQGRHYLIPEDVLHMVKPVLRHRIILTPEKEMEGISPDQFLDNLVSGMSIPR